MQFRIIIAGGIVGAIAIIAGWLFFTAPKARIFTELTALSANKHNGEYLLKIAGCEGCHTPSGSNAALSAPLSGGVVLETKFGDFVTPNITADPHYGIGNWTLDEFANALRFGVSPESEHYFPALPYLHYYHLHDQDIVDLWAAIQASEPVQQEADTNRILFPFSIRAFQGIWKNLTLYHKDQMANSPPINVETDHQSIWKRGQYLVEAVSHCGACHTPPDLIGRPKANEHLAGGVGLNGERVPSLSTQALIDGDWTEDDLIFALKTGILVDGDVFGGSMGEFVDHVTAHLTEDDAAAIAFYLFNR